MKIVKNDKSSTDDSRMRLARALLLIPWAIVALLLIVVAQQVGWAFFGAFFGLLVVASLLVAVLLGRLFQRQTRR